MSDKGDATLDDFCTQILLPGVDLGSVDDAAPPLHGPTAVSLAPTDGIAPPSNLNRPKAEPGMKNPPVKLALLKDFFWNPGDVLNVYFVNGTPSLQSKVMSYAQQWEALCNIHIRRVLDVQSSDIRVKFGNNGNNSVVGTRCKDYLKTQVTMNLQMDDRTPENIIKRRVLHEFGHAVGAVHEHESPAINIPWNLPAVYDYYLRTNGWDQLMVQRNVLHQYSSEDVEFSAFDPLSIMIYAIPASLTTNGFSTQLNFDLSPMDKSFIALAYPWQRRDQGSFSTNDIRPWNPPQLTNSQTIDFIQPYVDAPTVAVTLSEFDIKINTGIRVSVYADEIHRFGMVAHCDSWASTGQYSARCTWVEFQNTDTDFQIGSFLSTDVRNWYEPTMEDTKAFTFSTPFQQPPTIVCFLKYIDIDLNTNTTMKVWATDITTTGFVAHIGCWENTKMWCGGMTWIAYPANKAGVCSGSDNSNNYRALNPPQLLNGRAISFPSSKSFTKIPTVMLALNYVDFGLNIAQGSRINSYADNITGTGLTWHADSWYDTTVNAVGISYIALGDT
jgi:hypothetical protein